MALRIKRIPEDFQVFERTDVQTGGGAFGLYRLTKRWVGTIEAVEWLRERWNLHRDRVSFGGMKDFHGVTEQHVTVHQGPQRDLAGERTQLVYLGQTSRAFTSQDIRGNGFAVTLRDLDATEAERLPQALERVARDGVPNYFDDQRFGSLGEAKQFIALPWCKGDYERAVWLALADPNSHDSPGELEQKRILREYWADMVKAKAMLTRSHRRSIVTFLADRPGDFRGALSKLNIDLRSIWTAAFQSWVWNTMLATSLREICHPDRLSDMPLRPGAVPVFSRRLTPEERYHLQGLELPLPSARLHLDPGPMSDLVEKSCLACGLERREMRFKFPRDTFFSRGNRPAVLRLDDAAVELADDELHRGKKKAEVRFELPRGAYATMILKNLSPAGDDWEAGDAAEPSADASASGQAGATPAVEGEANP